MSCTCESTARQGMLVSTLLAGCSNPRQLCSAGPPAADQFQPSNEKLAEAVLGELSGRRFLGTRKVERMLRVGTHVTAVGELAAVLDKPGVKVCS